MAPTCPRRVVALVLVATVLLNGLVIALGDINLSSRHLLEVISDHSRPVQDRSRQARTGAGAIRPGRCVRRGHRIARRACPGQTAWTADRTPVRRHPFRGRRHAILNYAANAIKFTDHGAIVLRATLDEEDADSARVRIEVEDSGVGIQAAGVRRIVAEFEQADNSTTRRHGGTGLGLGITQRIARLMGGRRRGR